nr:BPTI/Kunitz domain-containing protein-like isoform X1 [Dermacentor andersoni]XP_054928509.1 BPTI/Kunitz domain-containing protein-like isoform X1 [Dermacentor andersoni]XP_054928510.1 BPTI/Kunitz domain-containing protein-like isoform X1 [Dermacentor andersoni]
MEKGRGYCLILFTLASSVVLTSESNPTALKLLRRLWKYSCEEPQMEPVGDCTANINKYFFNKTANMCQKFYWNGCLSRGVYETRYACALNCNEGEAAAFCAKPHPGGCETRKTRSWRQPHYEMDAFYYDIRMRACKSFTFCGPPVPPDSNFFTSLSMCLMECECPLLQGKNNLFNKALKTSLKNGHMNQRLLQHRCR